MPLTRDHRLSAKEVIGNREKLVEWQDRFHDHMAAEFPELERGEAAAVTKRKHVPTWLYKQAHRLTGEMAEIRAELEKTAVQRRAPERKDSGAAGTVVPRVNAFEAKLKPYDQQIRQIEAEKSALTRQTETAVYALDRKRREEEELIYELREVQDFLDSSTRGVGRAEGELSGTAAGAGAGAVKFLGSALIRIYRSAPAPEIFPKQGACPDNGSARLSFPMPGENHR